MPVSTISLASTLLPIPGKVLTRIFLDRLETGLDKKLRYTPERFWPGVIGLHLSGSIKQSIKTQKATYFQNHSNELLDYLLSTGIIFWFVITIPSLLPRSEPVAARQPRGRTNQPVGVHDALAVRIVHSLSAITTGVSCSLFHLKPAIYIDIGLPRLFLGCDGADTVVDHVRSAVAREESVDEVGANVTP